LIATLLLICHVAAGVVALAAAMAALFTVKGGSKHRLAGRIYALAMTVVAALGSGLNNAMIALGVAGIPFYARVVRSTTLAARELVYVRAARAVGMSDARIMLRHILPNIVSPILIMATLGLGGAILAAAGLSFLGLGAERPSPEWGLELSSSRHLLRSSWWISTFNGLAIAITVLSINLLGDGLREALDPQAGAWSH